MKKGLLLSVVASTFIMAGGDIAPAPVVVEEPTWEWGGTAKVYYQTMDHQNFVYSHLGDAGLLPFGGLPGGGYGAKVVGADNDMFDRRSSAADAGLQLRVANKDVIAGIGFGAEVTGLSTLNFVNYGIVTASMQSAGNLGDFATGSKDADAALSSAWISKAYLTYSLYNTSLKAGRMELPKSLSPFAFSEGWNIFKNTFEAALIVNSDLPDTTLVGAYVNRANGSLSWAGSIVAISSVSLDPIASHDLDNWAKVGDDGTYMLTAQNKSIAGLTATGSWYYAPSFFKNGYVSADNSYLGMSRFVGANINNGQSVDANVLWGDLTYANADLPFGLVFAAQGGWMDADNTLGIDSTTAWGARIGGHFGGFVLSAAYTGVDIDDEIPALTVTNFGTAVKSPLYTQQVLNQIFIDGHFGDSDTWQVKGVYEGLGGKFVAQYASSSMDLKANDYNEFDFIYATKFDTAYGDLGLKAMWMYQDFDGFAVNTVSTDDTNNVLRLIASYDF